MFLVWGLLAATASTDAASSAKDLIVVDAKGKEIGPVISVSDSLQYPLVQLTVNSFKFVVRVFSNGVSDDGFTAGREVSGSEDILWFESANCTGTPYMPKNPERVMPDIIVSGPGSTVYRPGDTGVTVFANSLLMGNGHPGGDCVQQTQGVGLLFRALPVIDLSTLFTPPFQVR